MWLSRLVSQGRSTVAELAAGSSDTLDPVPTSGLLGQSF